MPPTPTTYEQEERQRYALNVLENREQLIWHANLRNESVAQTALRFEKIFFGFDPAPAKQLYSEAAYGERLPDRLCIAAAKSKGKHKAPRHSSAASSPSDSRTPQSGSAALHPRPDTASKHRSKPERSSAAQSRASHPADRETQTQFSPNDDEIKSEQPSPSRVHGRRARSERSSGGSQTSSAKKKARNSLVAP